jgi:RNA polymerase sigma-70 factor (ECF subfamily)
MGDTVALALPAPDVASLQFDALYRSSAADVFAYAVSLLHDRAAAEDVTAAAFERAYRKQRTYKAGRGSERAWLFGIARNAALDELRRRKRRAALETDPEDVHAADPGDAVDGLLRREAVRAALGRLAPRERELVALKFAGGLSNDEIGRVLGISANNAGTRLHRTLEKLRRDCDEDA